MNRIKYFCIISFKTIAIYMKISSEKKIVNQKNVKKKRSENRSYTGHTQNGRIVISVLSIKQQSKQTNQQKIYYLKRRSWRSWRWEKNLPDYWTFLHTNVYKSKRCRKHINFPFSNKFTINILFPKIYEKKNQNEKLFHT